METYCIFAQDQSDDIRFLIATCLHEAFLLMSDDQDTSILRETLFELLSDENTDVMTALTLHMNVLIAKFCNK